MLLWSATGLGGPHAALNVALSVAGYGILAISMLRRGLLTIAVGVFAGYDAGNGPLTMETQAWYFSSAVFMLGTVVALAAWAFHTAIAGRRLWKEDLLE